MHTQVHITSSYVPFQLLLPQMWDLRYATAPMRTLEHHTRGILSIAWCPQDSDLLLSAAKDNLVYCWNPNSDVPRGEVRVSLVSDYFSNFHSLLAAVDLVAVEIGSAQPTCPPYPLGPSTLAK